MNRKIDNLGRIVIPKEMRKKLGLNNRDEAHIELIGDKIVITNENKKDITIIINEMIEEAEDIDRKLLLKSILERFKNGR